MKAPWLQLKRLTPIPATPQTDQEGQLRYVRAAGDDGEVFVALGAADDSVAWTNLLVGITVQEGDSTVGSVGETTVLDFAGNDFALTESPTGEVNVALAGDTPVWAPASQTASSTVSTTDITNWSPAVTASVVLPAGTWTVAAIGFIDFTHSAGARAHIRVSIDGDVTGAANSPAAPTTAPAYRTGKSHHRVTGIAGSQTISVIVQFKAVDAGTVTANNPAVWVGARRTA